MAKGINKKDEKLKINATFKDTLHILTGKKKPNQMKIIGQGKCTFEPNVSFELMAEQDQILFLQKNNSIKITPVSVTKVLVKLQIIVPEDTMFTYVSAFAIKKIFNNNRKTIEFVRENISFTKHPNAPIDYKRTIRFSNISEDFITDEILIFSSPIKEKTKVNATVFTQ